MTLDTTRPDYLSSYGFWPGHTPHLDRIAEEGVRFELALSSSALTPVSHATILTGRYQYHHGLRVASAPGGGFRLPETEETLTSRLRARGYATAAVHSAFTVSAHFGFDRGFDVFESFGGVTRLADGSTPWDTKRLQRRSDETTELAIATLEPLPEPFFLWVHYWDPHDSDRLPPAEALADAYARPPEAPVPTADDARYAAEVRYMDAQLGRLTHALRQRGILDDTLLVVTSDHGEGLSDGLRRHGWPAHRMLYQEQLRVPLLLRGPGVPAGRSVSALVRTVDIVPTLLDYLGLGEPAALDGASLRPLIEGRPEAPRMAYADQLNAYDANAAMKEKRPDARFLYALIEGDWKLIYRPHMPERSELFHLGEDPDELHDRLAEEPLVVRRLLAELAAREPWMLAPPGGDADGFAELRPLLEALHYVESEVETPRWEWVCADRATADPVARASQAPCNGPSVPVHAD